MSEDEASVYTPISMEQFHAVGEALYGPSWKNPLRERLGWSISHMARILQGTRPLPYKVGELAKGGTLNSGYFGAPTLADTLRQIAEERTNGIIAALQRLDENG